MNAKVRNNQINATQFFAGMTSEVGMTLAETLIASAIFVIVFISVIASLSLAGYRSEYARFNAAGAKFAEEAMERCRNAPWDPLAVPPIDMLVSSNFPADTIQMDTYAARGNPLTGGRTVTITPMPSATNASYKVINVQVVWSYKGRGPITNTLVSLRSTDR